MNNNFQEKAKKGASGRLRETADGYCSCVCREKKSDDAKSAENKEKRKTLAGLKRMQSSHKVVC